MCSRIAMHVKWKFCCTMCRLHTCVQCKCLKRAMHAGFKQWVPIFFFLNFSHISDEVLGYAIFLLGLIKV